MHPLKKRNTMELIIILTFLTFFFSVLQPTCSSLQVQSQHQGAVKAYQELSRPSLPRKLIFTEKAKESDEARDQVSRKVKGSLPSGKLHEKKQDMVVGKKGTRQEWIEEKEEDNDPSQYFTMDYNHVRRRPPIHNKQLPVGP